MKAKNTTTVIMAKGPYNTDGSKGPILVQFPTLKNANEMSITNFDSIVKSIEGLKLPE